MSSPTPIEVFYSYAHEDRPFCHELEKHLSLLRRQGLITQWHDRHISPGSNWAHAISMHLERASVILLLVSADFLASDYCYSIEMRRALERHQNKEARVIPILLRPVDWKGAPFAQLQALPTNAKPITSWSNRDEAFADVAVGLRQAIEDLSLLLNSEGCSQDLGLLPDLAGSAREAVAQDPGNMVIPPSLSDLANMLKSQKRQQGKAYNLLLTSTISLTPDVFRRICGSGSWTKFRTYLHRIGAESSNLIDLLSEHVGVHNNLDGYRALARLIKEGHFSTILTTNLDSTLEDTLLEIGLQPTAFQTLIVGRHQDESIVRALESSHTGIRIIKLHGSLRESVLPKQFPDFFELPAAIRENLSHSLNQDIVIVGSIERDKDIMRLLNASKKSRIYYVISRKSSRDEAIKLIAARGNIPRSSLISGPYGEFVTFFRTLEAKLLPSTRNDRDLTSDFDGQRYPQNFKTDSSVISKSVPTPLFLVGVVHAFLEEDETAFVGERYSVQADISQDRSPILQEERTAFPVHNITEPILFDASLHTSQNIELTPEWYKSLIYNPRNSEPQFVEFTFRVTASGPSFLVIDFYQERRWFRTARIEFNAIDKSLFSTVATEE